MDGKDSTLSRHVCETWMVPPGVFFVCVRHPDSRDGAPVEDSHAAETRDARGVRRAAGPGGGGRLGSAPDKRQAVGKYGQVTKDAAQPP
jgi:hypothetical protein